MTPEELHDEMINKADFDDAYIESLAKAFGALAVEDLNRFMVRMNDTQKSYTPEQRTTLQAINLRLAKLPEFTDALRRFSDWREKQPPAPPAPSAHHKAATPDAPEPGTTGPCLDDKEEP